jgi:hypothetical protein
MSKVEADLPFTLAHVFSWPIPEVPPPLNNVRNRG